MSGRQGLPPSYQEPPPPYAYTDPRNSVPDHAFTREARFDGVAQRTFPPPPPGVYPNMYQQGGATAPNPGIYPQANQSPYPVFTQQQGAEVRIGDHAFAREARFDGVAQPNIPPPPPGVLANQYQAHVARGGHVTYDVNRKRNQ